MSSTVIGYLPSVREIKDAIVHFLRLRDASPAGLEGSALRPAGRVPKLLVRFVTDESGMEPLDPRTDVRLSKTEQKELRKALLMANPPMALEPNGAGFQLMRATAPPSIGVKAADQVTGWLDARLEDLERERDALQELRSRSASNVQELTAILRSVETVEIEAEDRRAATSIELARMLDRFGMLSDSVRLIRKLVRAGVDSFELQNMLGRGLLGTGEIDAAISMWKRLEAEARNPAQRVLALNNLGVCYRNRGNRPEARRCYVRAARIAKRAKRIADEIVTRINIIEIDSHALRLSNAVRTYKTVLDKARTHGDPLLIAYAQHSLGVVYATEQKPNRARRQFTRARALYEARRRQSLVRVLSAMGQLEAKDDKPDCAEQLHREALSSALDIGYLDAAALAQTHLSAILLRKGELSGAFTFAHDAVSSFRQRNQRVGLVFSLFVQAAVEQRLGNHKDARTRLIEARKVAEELDDPQIRNGLDRLIRTGDPLDVNEPERWIRVSEWVEGLPW